MDTDTLSTKTCKPCEGGVAPLDPQQIADLLAQLPGWELVGNAIAK